MWARPLFVRLLLATSCILCPVAEGRKRPKGAGRGRPTKATPAARPPSTFAASTVVADAFWQGVRHAGRGAGISSIVGDLRTFHRSEACTRIPTERSVRRCGQVTPEALTDWDLTELLERVDPAHWIVVNIA